MELKFKTLGVVLGNLFTSKPELKENQTEVQAAMDADLTHMKTQVAELEGQITELGSEKTALQTALDAEKTQVASLKPDAEAYVSIKEEYQTLKTFHANHQAAIGGIMGEDGGMKTGGKTDAKAAEAKAEMERLKTEYPDLMPK